MAHIHFQSSLSISSGGLIARGPRVRDVMDVGRSGIGGVCLIGLDGCICGVDGNTRVGVTARARSSAVELVGEIRSGGGKLGGGKLVVGTRDGRGV